MHLCYNEQIIRFAFFKLHCQISPTRWGMTHALEPVLISNCLMLPCMYWDPSGCTLLVTHACVIVEISCWFQFIQGTCPSMIIKWSNVLHDVRICPARDYVNVGAPDLPLRTKLLCNRNLDIANLKVVMDDEVVQGTMQTLKFWTRLIHNHRHQFNAHMQVISMKSHNLNFMWSQLFTRNHGIS